MIDATKAKLLEQIRAAGFQAWPEHGDTDSRWIAMGAQVEALVKSARADATADLKALLLDIEKWRKAGTSPHRKIEAFGSIAAWGVWCDELWRRFEAALGGNSATAAAETRISVDGGALTMALNVLRRDGKNEIADALEATAVRGQSITHPF